jgi:HEAT repeat protein
MMDEITRTNLDNLHSSDRDLQNTAFFSVLEMTNQPVDWAYEVWEELVQALNHKDNHQRAIAAQVLCNLAKSDPENKMLQDFALLLAVTKDERFVTARHCLQSLWKVGVAGKVQQQMVVDGLASRFSECLAEKNATLIRSDIIQALRNVYDAVQDEEIREKALELIETEEDSKYRKKYERVWKAK